MSELKLQIEIIKKVLGDTDKVDLTKETEFMLNIENQDGSFCTMQRFKPAKSYQVDLNPKTGRAIKDKTLSAYPLDKDHRLAELLHKGNAFNAKLLVIKDSLVLKVKVKIFEAEKKTISDSENGAEKNTLQEDSSEKEKKILKNQVSEVITKLWNKQQ
jgi:hypothetical protein